MCKGVSIDDVGVSRDIAYHQEIRPGAGFETSDFVEEKFGGATTVEQLTCVIRLSLGKLLVNPFFASGQTD